MIKNNQSNYSEVKHSPDAISAIEVATQKDVLIHKSVSVIYTKKVWGKKVTYTPVTFEDIDVMRDIKRLIEGKYPKHSGVNLANIVIRFGWLDKTLNQLVWVPLLDIIQRFIDKQLDGTEKGKNKEIYKMLSISTRSAREGHITEKGDYVKVADLVTHVSIPKAGRITKEQVANARLC